jgi:hypothetical protein
MLDGPPISDDARGAGGVILRLIRPVIGGMKSLWGAPLSAGSGAEGDREYPELGEARPDGDWLL